MKLSLEYREHFRQVILTTFQNLYGDEEIWVFHPQYENIEVSSLGRVRNSVTGTIYKQRKTWQNYSAVSIIPTGNKKRSVSKIVHRLVAETFFAYVDTEFYEANHINGNKDDNSIYNINWLTRRENLAHAKTAGLLKPRFGKDNGRFKHEQTDVDKMFELKAQGFKAKEIAVMFNITTSSVHHIFHRRKKCPNL